MRHIITVRRNATSITQTGSTKFNWTTIIEGVPCSIQAGSGKMKVDEFGITSGHTHDAVFGAEMASILELNDQIVITNLGNEVFKVIHVHPVMGAEGIDFVEVQLRIWVPEDTPKGVEVH